MPYLKIVCSGPFINMDRSYYFETEDGFDPEAAENKIQVDEWYREAISDYTNGGSYVSGIVENDGD